MATFFQHTWRPVSFNGMAVIVVLHYKIFQKKGVEKVTEGVEIKFNQSFNRLFQKFFIIWQN